MTGHELRIERVKRDLKQIALATTTGIPRERLSRFENGWEALHPEELQRIREVLDQIPERGGTTPSDPAAVVNFTGDAEPQCLQVLSPRQEEP